MTGKSSFHHLYTQTRALAGKVKRRLAGTVPAHSSNSSVPASESAQVADYWDEHVGEHLESFVHWEANEPVRQHQNMRVSGDKEITALEWFWKKNGPFQDVANIGTGAGLLEQSLCSMPDFTGRLIGYDISPQSLEVAQQGCNNFSNVIFEVADLNTKTWDSERFDLVTAHGALHHIESLDWCLGQIHQALRPSGILYINDYVGPQRFQWSDVQMRIANELLNSVPPQWLNRNEVARFDAEELKRLDPSEAVCSHFIEITVQAHFHITERIPRGGTLLAPIIGSGCLKKQILDSPEGLQCLSDLAQEESRLIDAGILPSDHVVIVAEKRP